jgi:hypothetical protein
MKITKKLATKLHKGARRKNKKISVICVICGFIFFLIITLGLSPPVYTKSRKQEHKGKSNSFGTNSSNQSKKTPQYRSKSAPSPGLSRSSPPPRVENKKRSGGWGNSSANQGKPGKFGVKTGKIIVHPRKPPVIPDPIPQPRKKEPRKPKPPRKPCPGNSSWCPPVFIVPTPGDENEEDLVPTDSGNTLTPGESGGFAGKEYHISDSFKLDSMLMQKIDEYNANHLSQASLEYPLTHRSSSLTYQLLDSLELIEHMENKIQYYKQQLEAVRNSNLSPTEKSPKELFWMDRIERLEESKQKEEERVSELRSGIEEENRNRKRDW